MDNYATAENYGNHNGLVVGSGRNMEDGDVTPDEDDNSPYRRNRNDDIDDSPDDISYSSPDNNQNVLHDSKYATSEPNQADNGIKVFK